MKEKQIIKSIKAISAGAAYIGDDAAYLMNERLLISTDAMVENIHFLPEAKPYYLGWKVAAVNISDIAAMGGKPKYFLLAASLSEACNEHWTAEFIKGVNECCEQFGVLLIGGDLTTAERIYLCGTIIGEALEGKVAKRSFAEPGHKVIVTGRFGDSAAGLWAIQNGLEAQFVPQVQAHLKPVPRVAEGMSIVHSSARPVSMMDSSDGLLDCLQQISEISQVKLKVSFEKIPVSPELYALSKQAKVSLIDWVLGGGEDYQLLATTADSFDQELWTPIGEVLPGQGVELSYGDKLIDADAVKIFQHFC